jgi:hypothetical protein
MVIKIDCSKDFVDGEVFELSENVYGVTKKHWQCETHKRIQLVALFELIDRMEFDLLEDGEDEAYPIVVETTIMVHPRHFSQKYIKKFANTDDIVKYGGGKYSLYEALLDAKMYGCAIPVNPEGITSSRTCDVDSQIGKTRYGEFRKFKNFDDSEKYIREIYIPHMDACMGLCGFYLDRQLNMIGTTGWDYIGEMTDGVDAHKIAIDRVKDKMKVCKEGDEE